MTQPIQEPTPQRTDARLTWGQNQLFRRPAPVSGEDGACLYAETQWSGSQSISDDTPYDLQDLDNTGVNGSWQLGYVSDVDQIQVNLNDGTITALNPPFSGNVDQGGIWIGSLKVYYIDQFAGDMWTGVNWSSWSIYSGSDVDLHYQKAQNGNSHVFGETGISTSIMLVTDATPPTNSFVSGLFWQVSGMAQDIFQVVFTVCRLCNYPAPNGQDVIGGT